MDALGRSLIADILFPILFRRQLTQMRTKIWLWSFLLVLPFDLVRQASASGAEDAVRPRPSTTLLWRGPKAGVGGSISPDGRYISFVDWSTGDLCLHDETTSQDHAIVRANNPARGEWKAYAESSTISRDGSKIAYSWFDTSKNGYELWVANLSGDHRPRRLYAAADVAWLTPRDWSPDGAWVAVFAEFQDRTARMGIVSTEDGVFRTLKAAHWHGGSNMFFSPDGAYLAYDLPQGATTARDVRLIAVDGTKDGALVASRSDDSVMGWSPDGKFLLVASDRTGAMALWGLRVADGKPQGAPECLKSDLGLVAPMGMTKAGELVYGTAPGRRGGSIDVAGFDLASGAISSPHDVSMAPQENNVNPSWSPDGKYLAYVSERGKPGAAPTIVIRFADTGELAREIEPKLRRAELCGWEPGGKTLLAVGTDFSGRGGAFRIDTATGDASFVFAAPGAPTLSMPVWSADGRALYYWSRNPASDEQVFKWRDVRSGVE